MLKIGQQELQAPDIEILFLLIQKKSIEEFFRDFLLYFVSRGQMSSDQFVHVRNHVVDRVTVDVHHDVDQSLSFSGVVSRHVDNRRSRRRVVVRLWIRFLLRSLLAFAFAPTLRHGTDERHAVRFRQREEKIEDRLTNLFDTGQRPLRIRRRVKR